ncbi:protein-L-isoaspartate(D-aspartate) O-methyltransferase [Methylothermus subterraneus]
MYVWVGLWLLAALSGAAGWEEQARTQMVAEIEREFYATSLASGKSALTPKVKRALLEVPRHLFVPEALRSAAYENRPLPIGYGQTISQPYIVALMTELLEPKPEHVVLEVGTGSGYQAAVLARLVKQVYTIEIIEPLASRARARLKAQGYTNVEVRVGDGYYGLKEHAPFDGIVVTAAASHIPPPLVEQLKPGGRMVIPVGGQFLVQSLMLVEKTPKGEVLTRQLLPVSFVPLTGGH